MIYLIQYGKYRNGKFSEGRDEKEALNAFLNHPGNFLSSRDFEYDFSVFLLKDEKTYKIDRNLNITEK